MSKLLIKDLKENESFESAFLVLQKNLLISKTNRPYLSIKLADRSGEIEARVWDNAEEIGRKFERDDFIRINARPIVYQEKMQLNVVQITRLDSEKIAIEDFLPTSKRNIDEMMAGLLGLIRERIQNRWIKTFLLSIFEDAEIAKKFKRAPAAKVNHHAWIGGLLEHVLHLCELAGDVLKHYPNVNSDLVYTGLMLHDIGKIDELTYERSFGYTDEGQLVGHLIQGVERVYEKIRSIPDFPPKLKTHIVHLILAHHGQLEYGSPKLPMTLEAIMVHYLDDLDSKIQGVLDLSEKDPNGESSWTPFNRLFGRPMYKNSFPDLEDAATFSPPSLTSFSGASEKKSNIPTSFGTNLGEQLLKKLK